ncbi:Npun_F0494 family protein [Microcoleus sp.]|uniref:Npun_F0494 family protein n=1 Tax=Microcoleus sp. TaxID=44472 RepID=UPI003523C60B
MTFIPSEAFKSISYPDRTVNRADRAIRCSPFQLHFFQTIRDNSVFLTTIASNSGVEQGYTRSPVAELAAENSLLWLIQVGVLRREVDGQGITDSFRLTPLGRQLVEKWEQEGSKVPDASLCDRLGNAVSRGLGLFL